MLIEQMEGVVRQDVQRRTELRIAYCLPQYKQPGNNDTSYLQQMLIAGQLRNAGHHLTFVAPANLIDVICTKDLRIPVLARRTWSRSAWFEFSSRAVWRVQRCLGIPFLNVFSNYRLLDACMQCLPGHDIVQERNGLYKAGVAMACRRLGLPYILFFDGDDIFEHAYAGQPITGILRRRAVQIIRYNLATAERVICVSETARTHLRKVWQVPAERIEVFPNAVDVYLHRPYPERRATTRQTLGIGDDDPLVIFVGSFYPWQDVQALLDALTAVLKESPRVHLLLVGDGQQAAAMRHYAAELGLGPSVRFTGFLPQSEAAPLVGAADIAVAPYKSMRPELFYGSPMKVFEYMASGTAVIATAQGQISEVIEDGVNGILVPPGDTAAWVAAIKKLIGDPSTREQLGRQARQDAIERHSWDHYTARLEKVYESVLKRRHDRLARASY